jgi:glycosyltransferase involved in cell wall biosynthesis
MNESNKFVLTIAIPTFNRLDLLKECVKAFTEQIKAAFSDKVELLVINNASTDGTDLWLENYFKQTSSNFRYINSPNNIGAVPNVIRCIEQALGEYVWVFGDDDFPMPYSIHNILDLLSDEKYRDVSLFYMNSIRSDFHMRTYLGIYETSLELIPLSLTVDQLVHKFHLHLGLIITLLFKKDIWTKGKKFYNEKYYGYGFLGSLIYGSKGENCLYYSYPISIHRVGTQRYSSEVPLYVLSGIPKMFDDLHKKGVVNTEPLKAWQQSFSLLDFVKVLTIAKAFKYKSNHFIWDESLEFLKSKRKRFLLHFFRYLVPSTLARMLHNYGSVVKN